MLTSDNNTHQDPNIVKLVQGGSFTDDDAKLNKKLVSQEAYPWLYDLDNNSE